MQLHDDYLQLIRDALTLIQGKAPQSASPKAAPVKVVAPQAPPIKKAPLAPQKPPQKNAPREPQGFSLEKSAIAPSSTHDFGALLDEPIEVFSTPILVITPSLNEEERLLMQKMTEAISKHIALASLIEIERFNSELLKAPSLKVCLFPLSLTKRLPILEAPFTIHELRQGTPHLFPLAEINAYLHDIQLKKALWEQLKKRVGAHCL